MMENREKYWSFFLMSSALCWFVMDLFFWMEKQFFGSVAFASCAVLLNLFAFFWIPKKVSDILITLAESFWLFGNVSWMINDFFGFEFFISLARIFRFCIILSLIGAFISSRFAQNTWQSTLSRFRRMRVT